MKKAYGTTNISYQADCPHCGETTYSDIDIDAWKNNLEFGDGTPYGSMPCPDCKEIFYLEIED